MRNCGTHATVFVPARQPATAPGTASLGAGHTPPKGPARAREVETRGPAGGERVRDDGRETTGCAEITPAIQRGVKVMTDEDAKYMEWLQQRVMAHDTMISALMTRLVTHAPDPDEEARALEAALDEAIRRTDGEGDEVLAGHLSRFRSLLRER
jgi:hypothetical protein